MIDWYRWTEEEKYVRVRQNVDSHMDCISRHGFCVIERKYDHKHPYQYRRVSSALDADMMQMLKSEWWVLDGWNEESYEDRYAHLPTQDDVWDYDDWHGSDWTESNWLIDIG